MMQFVRDTTQGDLHHGPWSKGRRGFWSHARLLSFATFRDFRIVIENILAKLGPPSEFSAYLQFDPFHDPFYIAMEKGNLTMLRRLLELEVHMKTRLYPALHTAVLEGATEKVELLVKSGCHVDKQNPQGWSALTELAGHIMDQESKEKKAAHLLRLGAAVDPEGHEDSWRPITFAVKARHFRVASLFLNHGGLVTSALIYEIKRVLSRDILAFITIYPTNENNSPLEELTDFIMSAAGRSSEDTAKSIYSDLRHFLSRRFKILLRNGGTAYCQIDAKGFAYETTLDSLSPCEYRFISDRCLETKFGQFRYGDSLSWDAKHKAKALDLLDGDGSARDWILQLDERNACLRVPKSRDYVFYGLEFDSLERCNVEWSVYPSFCRTAYTKHGALHIGDHYLKADERCEQSGVETMEPLWYVRHRVEEILESEA